jgi:hypothetical protein
MTKGWMLILALAAAAALLGAEDQGAERVARLEERMAELQSRVAALEKWDADALRQDINRMRAIGGLLLTLGGKVPLDREGRVDVYHLHATGDLPAEFLPEWFRNVRTGVGPSMPEIKRGDYGHFPWVRFKGEVKLLSGEQPLLWDPRPGRDGKRLVGFADGAVRHLPENEVARILKAAGQG